MAMRMKRLCSSCMETVVSGETRARLCFSRSYAMATGFGSSPSPISSNEAAAAEGDDDAASIPTSGICRPLSEILKQLNKKVPENFLRVRVEDGLSLKYIPWHIVNRIMNLHAPEWSGEVRNIIYSADGKIVSVVYRVTLYGTDAEGVDGDGFSRNDWLRRSGTEGRGNGISSCLCPFWARPSSLSRGYDVAAAALDSALLF